MVKNNAFLHKLEGQLAGIPQEEREDILYDYEEYFRIGLSEGKSEEEIAKSLGDPGVLAKEFKASYMVDRAEKTTSTSNITIAVLATVSLGAFNLLFVLGPFIGVIGVVMGLFVASIAVIVAGVAMLAIPIIGSISWLSVPYFMTANYFTIFFFSIGLISLGLLFLIGVCYLSKSLYNLTLKYLKFNVKLITDRRVKNEL